MRLIDADALREALIKLQYEVRPESMNEACVRAVDNAPEIRIHTVTYRGTAWWRDETDIDDAYIVLRCAQCGKQSPTEQAFPFCPYCGGKMVGVTKLRKVKADD